jgi:hypothetical protein
VTRFRAGLASAALALVAVLVAGCGAAPPYHRYRASDVRDFTARCERTLVASYDHGTAAALCKCVLRFMHEDVTSAEFAAFTEAIRVNDPGFRPSKAISADLVACGV